MGERVSKAGKLILSTWSKPLAKYHAHMGPSFRIVVFLSDASERAAAKQTRAETSRVKNSVLSVASLIERLTRVSLDDDSGFGLPVGFLSVSAIPAHTRR